MESNAKPRLREQESDAFASLHLVYWAKNRRLVLHEVRPNVYRKIYLEICCTDLTLATQQPPRCSLFRYITEKW